MTIDTTYQRAKIIVEHTRELYFQILLFTGLFIFIAIRTTARGVSYPNPSLIYMNNLPQPSYINFIQSPLFLCIYVGSIFLLFSLYKYLKLYFLKRSFKNKEKRDKKLKKYMKLDKFPTREEIENKFKENKHKTKKKFYRQLVQVVIINIILFIVNLYYIHLMFIEIIMIFSILSIVYRHILIFHLEKIVFGKKWENNKIIEYIKEY
ncbi:2TM domain-containing protein [Methanobrevibacter filiformis]|uniref:2TM domain-containing protein n=1 Tax=Methanobrevibacter filiformis TaxID=55758 RepID=A0A165Z4L7_9EURY|nr:2TM domain-containing protein [Methanobrevibacter filiformis]KZX10242.1 hypothetical protein MBFIL_18590 [Methanobrevibacter filiformis]